MLLLKPYLGCNLGCKYCYEHDLRVNTNPSLSFDLDTILHNMESFAKSQIVLHGGEPLLIGKDRVEALLHKAFTLTGKSGIQTNGTLIDEDYLSIFKKYKTSVGISFDGRGELSSLRMDMRQASYVENLIYRLHKEGISTSVICVISKGNADSIEKLEALSTWLLNSLAPLHITGRLNPCYGSQYELPESQLIFAYRYLADFCLTHNLRWSPFTDIIKRLKGESAVCSFMGCDIYHTRSCTVMLGDGSITSCMRTNKSDILLRYPVETSTRDELLPHIPQENNGCEGCEFFSACHGGCPTTTSDWRDRTDFCHLWKDLFSYYKNILSFTGFNMKENKTERPRPLDSNGHGDWGNHGDAA